MRSQPPGWQQFAEDLGLLGIDAVSAAAYLELLRNPGARAEQVAGVLGVSPGEARESLGTLCEVGLARSGDSWPDAVELIDPQGALVDLAQRRLHDIDRSFEAATAIVRRPGAGPPVVEGEA